MMRRYLWWAAALIVLVAAGVRLHELGAQSLWNDEGSSYVQATRSFAEIAANAARDIHPPGYYALLAIWRGLVGDSEFALRALSVFASVIGVAFAYGIGRRLYGDVAGLTAALLTALNTFSIFYAQEMRMYALLALWGAAGMWALIGFFERPTWRRAALLGVINAAGVWTQYAYPFVMLAQGVVALAWLADGFSLRGGDTVRRFTRYAAANLLTIALYAVWLPTAWGQITTWPNTGDQTPWLEALGVTLRWLTFGVTAHSVPLPIPAILVLFGLTVRRRDSAWRWLLPTAWALLPLVIFLAAGLFRPDNVKVLIASQIGLALMIGRGVHVLWTFDAPSPARRTVTRAAAVTALAWIGLTGASLLPPLYSDPAYQRADYRAIVRVIEAQARPGDAIILNAPNQEEVFRYYYRADLPVYPLPPGLGGDDAETRAAVENVLANADRLFVVFWGDAERDPQRIVETTLDAHAFELGDTWYGDVRLARYVTAAPLPLERESGAQFGDAITLESYALNAESFARGDALQLRLLWRADAPIPVRYKVFVQLLDASGALAAQRDSEPGGGLALTTTWTPDQPVTDNHALLLDLPAGTYTLIAGLYSADAPNARLPVGEGDSLVLGTITVE